MKNPKNKMARAQVHPDSTMQTEFYQQVRRVLEQARSQAYRSVNFIMVEAYWNVGKLIVEEEQQGKTRADYGNSLIVNLSDRLMKEFGRGFDPSNVWSMRLFYLTFPKIEALRRELSWTHYRLLLKVEKEETRRYYLEEAITNHWSTRQLERQIQSFYYERILSTREKALLQKETNQLEEPDRPENWIKDPFVLEFLNIKKPSRLNEHELETLLIEKLQDFLLELGKGFSFVGRQYRISAETDHFYVDLVFYNYRLKCFVLIDLKTGKLTHQDIGQMDFYVRYFEDQMRGELDNPTLGIILCSEKNETIVKYSILKENKQLFSSKYQLYLPTEEELKKELQQERALIEREQRFR